MVFQMHVYQTHMKTSINTIEAVEPLESFRWMGNTELPEMLSFIVTFTYLNL